MEWHFGSSSALTWYQGTSVQIGSVTADVKQSAYMYGGPQVLYLSDMHIAALPSCFSSLLSTFLLF